MTHLCAVKECGARSRAGGYCNPHYQRWYKYGDPLAGGGVRYAAPEEAFEARTKWVEDCLMWTGMKDIHGYGKIKVNKRVVNAHRFAWEQAYGPIPEGMEIDHMCWEPACVNTRHLRLATIAENGANRSGPQRNNQASGVRNVTRNKKGWQVRIKKDGKKYSFGTYDSVEEAAKVAEQRRKELFGEFAGRG